MASAFAIQEAAGAWQTPKTKKIEMDVVLAEAFADIIERLTSVPWLGTATTRELLIEITTRIEIDGNLDYRTVNENEKAKEEEPRILRCWDCKKFLGNGRDCDGEHVEGPVYVMNSACCDFIERVIVA